MHLLQDLPLSDEVAETLSGTKTEMTPFLELAIACDEVRWNDMIVGAALLSIDHSTLNALYVEARRFATEITN
ncbi:hypothetical protein [Psychrobacillus sp. NEAU-3TGS]|uniref:hypothetical protein n=1 Tax=Psychrobacillus sp. NEAU-3TGS TaxID=2995412 RepID=UPI00249C2590|nr:hypothetical protein [Psychrobacillus sp. NEAU-3TGS]